MPVVVGLEAHAKEVPDVAENDQDEIRYVGCEEEVIRRLVLDGIWKLSSLMSTCIPVRLRVERTELCMLPL